MRGTKQGNQDLGLRIGFATLIVIFVVFGIFALNEMQTVADLNRTIYDHPLVVSNAANQANTAIAKMHRNMKDVVLFKSSSRVQKSIKAVDEEEKEVYRQLNTIRDNILGEKGKALEKEARLLFDDWRVIRSEVIDLTNSHQRDIAANITIGKGASHVVLLEEKMNGLTNYARKKASIFAEDTQRAQSRLKVTSIFFLAGGVLSSLLIAVLTLKKNESINKILLASEARYRSLIENQTDLVCRFTSDGQFTYVNDVYCTFFGVPEKEIIGSKWQPLPVDEDIDIVKEKLSTLSFNNPTVNIENRVRSGKGEIHWILFSNNGIFDSQGNLLEIQSIGRDITERKKIEEQLKSTTEREKEIADIVRNAPVAIAYGYTDGKLTNCNEAFCNLVGYSLSELKEVNWNEVLTPPKWRASEWEKLEQLSPTHRSVHYEKEYLHKDGSIIPIDLTVSTNFDSAGNIINFVGFIVDISERKEFETQLRQKHKMEAVGYMAGGMAHNFNNNLSIILGNVELSQLKQAPNSEVIPLLENAKIAVRRSRDLVQKIITYSRKGIQRKTSIRLPEIISETVTLLQSTLPSTVSLEQIISPACDSVVVNADASQIQEVLVNLCNNAVHAMDEKGKLKIFLKTVELNKEDIPAQYEQAPGRYAKLSVQDTGSGMPAEMLDKIFDPFYTTKEEYEGAGMGLATVEGIVVQHGGLIKVNSIPKQGTVFDLYFPLVDGEITEPAPTNTELPRGTEQILFIDDDEMLASLGGQLLTQIGYQVSVMTDSIEALKLFTANADSIDLVITDQTMPDLCGKDLIQELKKVRHDIPTILCTGFSSKIDEDTAKELDINAFMMKPLDLPKLSQIVRRVLDEEKNG